MYSKLINHLTKPSLHLFVFTLLFFSPLSGVIAQVFSLQGSVYDLDTRESLPGINVIVMGETKGAATAQDGRFLIEDLIPGKYTLLISAIGYETKYIDVNIPVSSQLNVPLKETFFQMQSVVVTGTRSEKIHLNTPIATEVITTQDIEDSGARDLGELLEQRAGVSMSSSVEGGTIVNVLGMDSKYVMILIDGQPITGKFNNRDMLDQITISNIEKVEVVKGPGSSLYGSEAMGGVINIITRTDASLSPLLIQYRHSGSAKSFKPLAKKSGQRNLVVASNYQSQKLRAGLNADLHLVNVDKSIQHIDVDQYQNYSLSGNLHYLKSTQHQFSAQLNLFKNLEEGSASLLASSTLTGRTGLSLNYTWSPTHIFDLQLLARSANYTRNYEQKRPWGEVIRDEKTQEDQREIELLANIVRDKYDINLGAEIGQNSYTSDRVQGGHQKVDEQALFFQLEVPVSDKWTAVSGVRWDHDSDFSSVYNPKLALMYHPTARWRYRFSAGSGYRKPSFMDRYIDWNHQQFGYRIAGNPDLLPERSVGLTAGVDYYHPSAYQASVFAYINRFSDMIVDSLLQPGVFTYVNVAEVNYSGLELNVRWSVNQSWLSSWSYNYSLNRDIETGRVIPNLPNHTGTVRLTYKHPRRRWSAALKTKFVGSYEVDEFIVLTQQLKVSTRQGYVMVDLDGHYNINSWLKLSAGARNILDITDDRYGPFLGRSAYIELQTKMKGK